MIFTSILCNENEKQGKFQILVRNNIGLIHQSKWHISLSLIFLSYSFQSSVYMYGKITFQPFLYLLFFHSYKSVLKWLRYVVESLDQISWLTHLPGRFDQLVDLYLELMCYFELITLLRFQQFGQQRENCTGEVKMLEY